MSQASQAAALQPVRQQRVRLSFPRWQAAVAGGLIFLLYYAIVWNLVRDWWNDPNFSHGFFVPMFSGFLVWQKRQQLAALPLRPTWFGVLAAAGAMLWLVVGVLGSELFLSRSSLVALAAGLILAFGGWAHFRLLLFPWALLFLMIPIPAIIFNQVTFPLQLLASRLASAVLSAAGVPVLRQGNVIHLAAMPLEVAEACSGIRSLISLGTLALMYGYFLERRSLPRVALALAAVPIAVAANSARIVGTGLLVQYWDPEKALGFFHEFSGLVVFLVSLALLFGVHGLFRIFGDREAPRA
jgi:exosortase